MFELPNHDEIFHAVGGALSNWSLVELQLATLFEALSDIPDQNKSAALFGAIIAFDARLAVCDRLMLLEKAGELHLEMWAKMSAKLSKFYRRRHELAHFSLNYNDKLEPVISPFLTTEKLAFEKVRILSLEEIQERSGKFIELHQALGWFKTEAFWRRVKRDQPREPESEEPTLVPRLRELAALSLEERKQQQKPQRR